MTRKPMLAPELQALLARVTGKRARIVADHIARYGFVTTQQLQERYGYHHPPRAKQDLQEQGIPIETFFVKDDKGRRIGAYRFGVLAGVRKGRFVGRRAFPKRFKRSLMETQGATCRICRAALAGRYLQVDHRIPYQVAGEVDEDRLALGEFMLLCASCNRAKSWSCEHCPNSLQAEDPGVCGSCYWASPDSYEHIATVDIRRLDLVWLGEEVRDHARLSEAAEEASMALPDFVKAVLAKAFNKGQ